MPGIIVYFSREGSNYVNGTIRNLTVGNTEAAAKMLQEITGAGLFKLEQAVKYSENFMECLDEARADQRMDIRPELIAYPSNMEDYDIVYLGYPNYWGTMPMAVFTFLEEYEFSGKRIKPFCTHGGSGMGSSIADIQRLCPGAIVEKGLSIYGADVEHAKNEIRKWAKIEEPLLAVYR